MPAVRYRVPYELVLHGVDVKSGKQVTNIFYYRSRIDTGSPLLTYGEPITGTSTGVVLSQWESVLISGGAGSTIDILSINFNANLLSLRAMVSRQWTTPVFALTSVASGLAEAIITTSLPNGFTVGQSVSITGITTPSTLNGNFVVTVIDTPSQFRVAHPTFSGWSLDGQVQAVGLTQEIAYDDRDERAVTITGDITGDACPNFATCSIKRVNSGTGRNWRSRVSMGPIAEASQINGKFTPAWQTIADGYLSTMGSDLDNIAVTTRAAHHMEPTSVSHALAMVAPAPFVQSETWAKKVSTFINRPNLGSMLRRKPKLGATIAS